MTLKTSVLGTLAVLSVASSSATLADANAADERDWPCEQALVPEVSAVVVWDGPNVDDVVDRRQPDPGIDALAQRLAARRTTDAEAEAAIEAFAKAQPAAARDRRLTVLFASVLNALNDDRRALIRGILRYARDQQRRADQLGEHLSEFAQLETQGDSEQLKTLQQRLRLEQRMFDDRERTIPHLCTRPRALERRIGALARAIAYHLE